MLRKSSGNYVENNGLELPQYILNHLKGIDGVGETTLENIKNLYKIIGLDGMKIFLDMYDNLNDENSISYEDFVQYLYWIYSTGSSYTPINLKDYLLKILSIESFEDINEVLFLLSNYIGIAKELELKVDKYPKDLKEEYDELLLKYNDFKLDNKNKNFTSVINEYKDLLNYVPESESYTIKVPENIEDMITEGDKLNHAVGFYCDRVIEGRSKIFFVREKDNLDTPFVTVELNKDNILVQSKSKYNGTPNVEVLKFIKNWVKNIEKN